jgi:hypothetical protein
MRAAIVGTGVAKGEPATVKATFSDTAFSPLLHRSPGMLVVTLVGQRSSLAFRAKSFCLPPAIAPCGVG